MNDLLNTFNVSDIEIKDVGFMATAICFIFEQFFYWFLGSYPYRYGILIKRLGLAALPPSFWNAVETYADRLSIRKRHNAIYMRYKFPLSIIGPHFFVGQIRFQNIDELKIRVGPFSALFVAYLAISPLFDFRLYGLLNSLIIVAVICWFYISFYSEIKKLIRNAV